MAISASRQQYIDANAEAAMEQMRRYGIPASVTLAQGIIESANGKSTLAQTANNHFGVKGTFNGAYVLANDNKPNEKFKKYDSVSQSFEDHSKVLMASRYTQYTKNLAHDDYKGWAAAIKKGGYATDSRYVGTIVGVIEGCNLQKYDQMVLEQMKREGKQFGVEANPLSGQATSSQTSQTSGRKSTGMNLPEGKYSMPIQKAETILVTSAYGKREDPVNKGKTQIHHGIDINARHDNILATENGGKIIGVNHSTNTGGGKSVTVEYSREDGTKTRVQYMHLSQIDVKVGDTVNAGQKLGVTGNTGTRTTGEHLHFGVINVDAEGKQQWVNPAAYLAEINAKGNLAQHVNLKNGTDLLAQYQSGISNGNQSGEAVDVQQTDQEELTPDNWMKMLMASEGLGTGEGGGLFDSIIKMFMTMMMLVMNMENKSKEEKMEAIADAVINQKIDISSMVPNLKSAELSIKGNGENKSAVLTTNDGKHEYRTELTEQQTSQLSQILHSNLDDEAKKQRVGTFVSTITFSQQASQNYEQISTQQQSQEQQLQRK